MADMGHHISVTVIAYRFWKLHLVLNA